ncbi:hypothetical protein AKJ09_09353 [Labilithrix luteola]|uniref:Type IV fimbrial biogenesis protein PilY1 n=1 Tax=Labilithrix luteola TaxID=1391654 RepID=A0A0K1QBA6_9BACT|nr:hypothetical protein AKJ09_09353 [Labilithrix luteola]
MVTGCASDEDAPSAPIDAVDSGGPGLDGDVTSDGAASTDASEGGDAAIVCSPDGWCPTALPGAAIAAAEYLDPVFVPIDLHDVWVTPEHEAWAVAEQGYVLHWAAGAWSYVFGANVPLHTVWVAGPGDVWAGGPDGVVFHGTSSASAPGTFAFGKVELGVADDILRIRGTSASDILAITANGIFHSAGTSFEELSFPSAIPGDSAHVVSDMWKSDEDVWIAAREYSTCNKFGDTCDYQDHTLLVRWKHAADPNGDPSASFDRIPLALSCSGVTCAVVAGATAPDGSHYLVVKRPSLLPFSKPPQVAHVAPRDAGILDASAAGGNGDWVWSMDDAALAGTTPEGIWTAASTRAWIAASPGSVRRWDGQIWSIGRVAIGSPLTKRLHAIGGVVDGSGKADTWIVGENIALHRTESP